MESIYRNLGGVIEFPEFKSRKLYMYKMKMDEVKLPKEFNDFEETIDQTLNKVKNRDNICYITIHEKQIKNGTHRRGGIHVDFNWYENLNSHGKPGHKRVIGNWSNPQEGGWGKKELEGGGMLLVSNYEACQVWKGKYNGEIGEGGCCKNIDVSNLETEIMPKGHVYYLNSLGIHESLPIDGEVNRSLIRINFHPDYIFN